MHSRLRHATRNAQRLRLFAPRRALRDAEVERIASTRLPTAHRPDCRTGTRCCVRESALSKRTIFETLRLTRFCESFQRHDAFAHEAVAEFAFEDVAASNGTAADKIRLSPSS